MRVLLPSVVRRLAPATAALALGLLLGFPAPTDADSGGVLNACVYTDRHGEFHGDLRIVGAHERCSRWETRVTIPLGTPGGSAGSGDDTPALGGIKGVALECQTPPTPQPFLAYLNRHSFVVYNAADADQVVNGQFEMHNVPPGTYELHLNGQKHSLILKNVEVAAGEVTDLQTINLCLGS